MRRRDWIAGRRIEGELLSGGGDISELNGWFVRVGRGDLVVEEGVDGRNAGLARLRGLWGSGWGRGGNRNGVGNAGRRGRAAWNCGRDMGDGWGVGRVVSAVTRARIRDSRAGRYEVVRSDGLVVGEYVGYRGVAAALGVSVWRVRRAARGGGQVDGWWVVGVFGGTPTVE